MRPSCQQKVLLVHRAALFRSKQMQSFCFGTHQYSARKGKHAPSESTASNFQTFSTLADDHFHPVSEKYKPERWFYSHSHRKKKKKKGKCSSKPLELTSHPRVSAILSHMLRDYIEIVPCASLMFLSLSVTTPTWNTTLPNFSTLATRPRMPEERSQYGVRMQDGPGSPEQH